jgi:hypothetical protein
MDTPNGGTVIDMPPTEVWDDIETGESSWHDDWTIEVKALAVHTGDYWPVSVREAKELKDKGENTELMEIPLSFIDLYQSRKRRRVFDQGCEPVLPKDLKRPIRRVWSDNHTEEMVQKANFLRLCMHMVYILDSGELTQAAPARRLFEALDLSHSCEFSTDASGREYCYQTVSDGLFSGSSGDNASPSVLEMYGGNKQQAHTHWCNTH